MFSCRWTTYLDSNNLVPLPVTDIKNSGDNYNIHVSKGLQRSVTFLIITIVPYNYSYLFTYLLTYLLT